MRRAFTLVELLVVIAIIGVLVALILPSLAGTRELARTAICQSNQKQIMLAMTSYAMVYKTLPGTYWQGPRNLDWSGRENATYRANPAAFRHPLQTSVLYEYLSTLDRIMECPTAKRAANKLFDYTMVIRFAGARLDLTHTVEYPSNPASAASPVRLFPSLPILVEEHEKFYNRSFDDGSFAGSDQWTTRHARGGHTAYLDGSATLFQPPVGGRDDTEEAADLNASLLRLRKGNLRFPVNSSNAAEWGWVNRPR